MKPTIRLGGSSKSLLRSLLDSLRAHPRRSFLLLFVLLYLATFLTLLPSARRDPSSLFFSEKTGYAQRYSLARSAQAAAFVNATNASPPSPRIPAGKPRLCLGVPTVARPSHQYIHLTIGSLLEGLTADERDALHLVLLIAHTDPAAHPIHAEPWPERLPDALLTYAHLPASERAQLAAWEATADYRPKALFDYGLLLETCTRTTPAPFAAVLEGDVLAARGWLARTLAAAHAVEDQDTTPDEVAHAPKDDDTPTADWLYLRLFYTETYLGWNREEWRAQLGSVLLAAGALLAAFLALRLCLPPPSRAVPFVRTIRTSFLSAKPLLIALGILFPACALLYFALGRTTVQPPAPGLHRMDEYGCCAQGMVFAARMVPFVRARLREPGGPGYTDMLLEQVAAKWKLGRWVLRPSVLQHIGAESSKGDEVADRRARMIWSFAFELWDEVRGAG